MTKLTVAAPPPVNAAYPRPEEAMAGGGVVMTGQTTSAVAVQVDFALVPK